MSLESLPNELLLDLFALLTTAHLFRAFQSLNHRFDSLLRDHFCVHGLDFRSISKHDFDIICRKHLSSIVDQVTSLRLSNADDSPQQTECFLVHGFTLRQFIRLRLFSLHNLFSVETINKTTLEWRHLPNLTYLKLDYCYFSYDQTDVLNIVNSVWNLSKLIYCHFGIFCQNQVYFPVPTAISSSLEHLSILGMEYPVDAIPHLLEHTPHLRYLSTCFTSDFDNDENEDLSSAISSINTLDMAFYSLQQNRVVNILQNMPNLYQLRVCTFGEICIDGHQWEQFIHDHLPKLKRFRFQMTIELVSSSNKEQQVDQLLDSFRGRFWLEEHDWFVRCDWHQTGNEICVYTLPYTYEYLHVHFPFQSKSTCPHDHVYWSYDCVRRLTYKYSLCENFLVPHIHFSNVQQLNVTLPIGDHFWCIVPKFDQLTSLYVSWNNYTENYQSHLQALLDRASRLYSLRFESSLPSQMLPFDNTSVSVRQLDFDLCNDHYNNQQCAALSRSLLGIQCEVLLIKVENRRCVLELVNGMANLRALKVLCLDDKKKEQPAATEDELVEWLRQQLPSGCTITRSTRAVNEIRLWIR